MWDTRRRTVLPNMLKGDVRHHSGREWDIFGGDDRSGHFFINVVTDAQNDFSQSGLAGYLGIGPGLAPDYTDHLKWSVSMQMKK